MTSPMGNPLAATRKGLTGYPVGKFAIYNPVAGRILNSFSHLSLSHGGNFDISSEGYNIAVGGIWYHETNYLVSFQ